MKNYFYLDANNQQQGPVSEMALSVSGVTSTTLVWCEGMTEWTPAGNVPELAPYLPRTNAPGVPPIPPASDARPASPCGLPNPQQYKPREICPETNMVWAILSTVLCCLPTGVYAIIRASKVEPLYNSGDIEGARRASKDALNWSIGGAIASFVVGVLYFLMIIALAI